MLNYLLIAGFGAAGAVARYAVESWVGADAAAGEFPWGTLAVNIAGAFLLGILVALTVERLVLDENWRIALGVGFLGSFTTFSGYAYQSIALAEESAWLLSIANVVAMVMLGLAAAIGGLALGRAL